MTSVAGVLSGLDGTPVVRVGVKSVSWGGVKATAAFASSPGCDGMPFFSEGTECSLAVAGKSMVGDGSCPCSPARTVAEVELAQ